MWMDNNIAAKAVIGREQKKKEIRKKEYEVNKIRQVKNTGFSLKTYLCYLTVFSHSFVAIITPIPRI